MSYAHTKPHSTSINKFKIEYHSSFKLCYWPLYDYTTSPPKSRRKPNLVVNALKFYYLTPDLVIPMALRVHNVMTHQAVPNILPNDVQSEQVPVGNSQMEGFNIESKQIDWSLSEIKKQLAVFCEEGRISWEITVPIYKYGAFAPVEFDCLDYKEQIEDSPYDRGKLVKRIVSFYNTFGGYLIIGVAETEPETKFEVCGFNGALLNCESLKASLKEYTGERIAVTPITVELRDPTGAARSVTVLHIPKRPHSTPPVHFIKDGPPNSNKKPVFLKDQIYCRRGDECVEAKGPKILELNGERRNPYLQSSGLALSNRLRVTRIHHNLPNRNFICSKFIGRETALNALWRWLGDDLSQARVLAGEGGLGKSSIAFEFAERVSETRDANFEQIIWLTAKEKQFNALEDKYVPIAERHFTSYEGLLFAICNRLAFTEDELEGATSIELKRKLKHGLMQIPSLVVIDDVDSLSIEEQRQVLELAMVIGGGTSRLLLTTRFNQSYSQDIVIKISGFALEDEFPIYLDSLCERLQIPRFKTTDVEKIHAASSGSPLFTESLLRLQRFTTLGEAISTWKGHRGTAVRAAALKREIELLNIETQRVLVTIALLREASLVEVCEVLGYASEIVEQALSSLESLFLISVPSLASIARFSVPENTRRLVLDQSLSMVTNHLRLQRDVEEFRKRGGRSPNKDRRVADAISQAESLAKVGKIEFALQTITDAKRRVKEHPDLLCYEANLIFRNFPEKFDNVRRLVRKAFEKGCSRIELYVCWFEAEWAAKHYIGALEAAEAALSRNPLEQEWLIRKSAALASRAEDFARAGSITSAIRSMFEASDALHSAIELAKTEDASELKKQQELLHDQIWHWSGSEQERGLGRLSAQIDVLEKIARLGDFRVTNIRRQLSTFENAVVFFERKGTNFVANRINLYDSLLKRGDDFFSYHLDKLPKNKTYEGFLNEWRQISTRSYDVCSCAVLSEPS